MMKYYCMVLDPHEFIVPTNFHLTQLFSLYDKELIKLNYVFRDWSELWIPDDLTPYNNFPIMTQLYDDIEELKYWTWTLIEGWKVELSEESTFVTEGITDWFEMLHCFGKLKVCRTKLSSFEDKPIALVEFRSPLLPSGFNPVWGIIIGLSPPGKDIGCKLKPFLIINICKINHKH